MEYRKKIPAEAVELYSRFIHGEIGRRDFLQGVERFAVAGLTAAAIVEALMPNYALGQQVRKDDERIKASYETIPVTRTAMGTSGAISSGRSAPIHATDKPAKLPGVIVIHENRGLNPHTEDVARRFALENFIAFAPDALTSVGGYPGDDYKGGQLFAKLDRRQADPGFHRRRAVAEGASGLQRQNLRHRLLLWRRHGQHPGRPAGPGSGGRRAVLRRRAQAGRRGENQGGDPRPPRRAR